MMNHYGVSLWVAIFISLTGILGGSRAYGETVEANATALLEGTGLKGGVCLVVGATNTALATQLASRSGLYVQMLQTNGSVANTWGLGIASSTNRESMGVRHAGFNDSDYDWNLFNLIVVEDAGLLGTATLTNLYRILVPQGYVALANAPGGFAVEAEALGMSSQAMGDYPEVYRKPVLPDNWRIADALKWRAGARSAYVNGYSGHTYALGRYFYRERMEVDWEYTKGRSELVARDAYNGRKLWSVEETAGWEPDWGTSTRPLNCGLAADKAGRLFANKPGQKLVCLDAATGAQLFELMSTNSVPAEILISDEDRYVISTRKVFSATNGATLWSLPSVTGSKWVFGADEVYVYSHNNNPTNALIASRDSASGSTNWIIPRTNLPPGSVTRFQVSGDYLLMGTGDRWVKPYTISAIDGKTGAVLWTNLLGGTIAEANALTPNYSVINGKLFAADDASSVTNNRELFATRFDLATGVLEAEDYGPTGVTWHGNGCYEPDPLSLGDYFVYHHNIWVHKQTLERTFPYIVHGACFTGKIPVFGMLYNFASRKQSWVQGITAIGPSDSAQDHEAGGNVLQLYGSAPEPESTGAKDWSMFRGNTARGNSSSYGAGDGLVKAWEVQVGLGGKTYGVMNGERTGLTQPVTGYGLVVVSDIGGQRVVAIDATDGSEAWVFPVGARVDFSPTLYKGMCFFAAKDGWVYCLNAKTGTLIWRLLVSARERFIGGQEKLESMWPTAADVMIANGVGYVSAGFGTPVHGGSRALAFVPETGAVLWSKCYNYPYSENGFAGGGPGDPGLFTWLGETNEVAMGGLKVNATNGVIPGTVASGVRLKMDDPIDDVMAWGNSISRLNEDKRDDGFSNGRVAGRLVAFSDTLSVAQALGSGTTGWNCMNPLTIRAVTNASTEIWSISNTEFVVDDAVVAPGRIYCVGHYQRVDKDSELWVVDTGSGAVMKTAAVDGFPAFMGMSLANDTVYVATRDGKLIAYSAPTEIQDAGPVSPVTMRWGATNTFWVTAAGVGGSPVTYEWLMDDVTQAGMTNSTFLYVPGEGAIGEHILRVIATDTVGGAATNDWVVTVTAADYNTVPVISNATPASPLELPAEQEQIFAVTAGDAEGDPLSYAWRVDGNVSSGETNTTFSYTPANGDQGLRTVRVIVSDSLGGTATNDWSVTVTEPIPNAPPVVSNATPASPVSVASGGSQVFTVTAGDADGDGLSYEWKVDGGVKAGATNASFTYSPTVVDIGSRVINVVVGDGRGGYATNVWAVTVVDKMPLYVARSGAGGAYTSIVAAIAAAVAGDTIRVIESPHTENSITVSKSVKIEGLGASNTIVQAAGTVGEVNARIFTISGTRDVGLRDLTLQNASYIGDGTVLYSGNFNAVTVTVERCAIRNNNASGAGAGVRVHSSRLTVVDSTFSDNKGGTAGAIYAYNCSGGVTIRNSPFSGNVATNGDAAGVYVTTADAAGAAQVYNSTFVSNRATKANSYAGGLRGGASGFRGYAESCVFADNTCNGDQERGTRGSDMQYVQFTNCVYEGDLYGSLDLGHNTQTTDAGVNKTLAYNGGQTRTHALLTNSPAIDMGSNPAGLMYDQRGVGYSRTVGGVTDAGAYEYGAGIIEPSAGTVFSIR